MAIPEPLDASTVVLLREAEGSLEVLLVRRAASLNWAPGAYVFPGGIVEPRDAEEETLSALSLPTVSKPGFDPPFYAAALRELFEEAGILLAKRSSPRPPRVPEVPGEEQVPSQKPEALRSWRSKIHRGEATLGEALRALGLTGDASSLVPFGRWVTPVVVPSRFDARFFLARLPPNMAARTDMIETDVAIWTTPRDAVQAARKGRMPMMFPTYMTLLALTAFRTWEEALAWAKAEPAHPVLPRVVWRNGRIGIALPWEEEYARAPAAPWPGWWAEVHAPPG